MEKNKCAASLFPTICAHSRSQSKKHAFPLSSITLRGSLYLYPNMMIFKGFKVDGDTIAFCIGTIKIRY